MCWREVLEKSAVEKGPQCCVAASRPGGPLAFCVASVFRLVMIFVDVPGPPTSVTMFLAFLLLRLAVAALLALLALTVKMLLLRHHLYARKRRARIIPI